MPPTIHLNRLLLPAPPPTHGCVRRRLWSTPLQRVLLPPTPPQRVLSPPVHSPQSQAYNIRNFIRNPFEDVIDFHEGGVMQLAVRWPLSIGTANTEKLQQRMYIHGLWPQITPGNYTCYNNELKTRHIQELHDTYLEFKSDLLKYWPDLQQPDDIKACEALVKNGWKKHGRRAGMSPRMFIFYALAMRDALPDNFGITVGKPLTVKEASKQVMEQLKKMVLFEEDIGANVYPEVQSRINPKNRTGARLITEVRICSKMVLVNNKVKLRLMDSNIHYSGACNHHSNIVILP